MEAPVEIRYAGVIIGQALESRNTGDDSFFIAMRDPMPVGSLLRLRTGDREAPARVIHVNESPDRGGMSVRLLDDAEAAAFEAELRAVALARAAETAPDAAEAALGTAETAPELPQQSGIVPPENPRPQTEAPQERVLAQPEAAVPAAPASDPPAPDAGPVPHEPAPQPAGTDEPVPAPAVQIEAQHAVTPTPAPESEGNIEVAQVAGDGSLVGALPSATASNQGEPAKESGVAIASTESADSGRTALGLVEGTSGPIDEVPASAGDLPPARPVASPSGRRKSKRRK